MNRFFGSLFLVLICSASSARAGLLLDLAGGYFSDALTTSSSENAVKYAYNLGVYFSFNKTIWGGWSYAGFSTQDTRTSASHQLDGQDTGPALKWQFGRGKNFSLGATYNFLSRATYTTSTATEEWEGTSFSVQFAVMPEIYEGLRLGIALNYYAATYNLKKLNQVESSVAYSKQWLYPSFMLTKQF